MSNEDYVVVCRQGDYRKAKYPFESLADPHWDNVSGGSRIRMTQYYIFGYVTCNAMLDGELAHNGEHGPCPHSIKVCVLQNDNTPEVFKKLIEKAGNPPRRYNSRRKHHCITDIIDVLENQQEVPISRKVLLDELEKRGHSESAMVNAIKGDSRILKERDPDNARSWTYKLIK